MISTVLTREFLAQPTVAVAPALLGQSLCRRFGDGNVVCAPIVEVEAYTADDPACHAFRGLTERCRVMFGPPGYAYVYFIYGRYNCLNVVTEENGVPGAVLIRALGLQGGSGPGKLCDTLCIDRSFNGIDLLDTGGALWLAPGPPVAMQSVAQSERIGISSGQDRHWRFYLSDNRFISGPRKLGGGKIPRAARKGVHEPG